MEEHNACSYRSGHVAELHQEIDHASRTGREDLSSGRQWAIESCHDPALISNLHTSANITENGRSACGYKNEKSIDGDTVMSSLGDSDIDDDDDHLYNISPNFIAEAADLTHHRSPPLSFEDVLAQEESLLPDNGLDDIAPSISKSLTTETACQQHGWADTERGNGLVNWKEAIPPRSTTLLLKTARSVESRRPRLSDKKDLMPSEISVVAQCLIRNDSIVYLLNNCRLIYESLIPSTIQQPLLEDYDAEDDSLFDDEPSDHSTKIMAENFIRIRRRAMTCFERNKPEASWGEEVVRPLLDLGTSLARTERDIVAENVASTNIYPLALIPRGPSDDGLMHQGKRVDYGFFLEPTAEEDRLISNVLQMLPNGLRSINQTDASYLRHMPMLSSVELKKRLSNHDPLLQLAIWNSALFQRLQDLVEPSNAGSLLPSHRSQYLVTTGKSSTATSRTTGSPECCEDQ